MCRVEVRREKGGGPGWEAVCWTHMWTLVSTLHKASAYATADRHLTL